MRQLVIAATLFRRLAVATVVAAALFFVQTAVAAPMSSAKEIRAALFHSDGTLEEFTGKVPATEFFPDATGYGAIQDNPPIVPVLKGEEVLGYVFLNSSYVPSGGYSGKPIHIMIAVDKDFTIKKAKLVKHSEPIVLIGIPVEKVNAYIDAYTGRNYPRDGMNQEAPDVISGATVTVMVINETIARASIAAAKAMQGGGEEGAVPAQPKELSVVDMDNQTVSTWQELTGNGAVRSFHLKVGEVNEAFAKSKHPEGAEHAESANPEDEFIEMFYAPVSVPSIGRSLLGDTVYEQMTKQLQPGQQAILVAGKGLYSFKGSGYVRGGIFDRLKLKQDGNGFHFRDRNHRRIGDILATGAPHFPEIALFTVPTEQTLDVARPWQLELLVQRATGARDKAFITFDMDYNLPAAYTKKIPNPDYVEPPPAAAQTAAPADAAGGVAAVHDDGELSVQAKIAQQAWRDKTVQIVVLGIAIFVLVCVFMFQDWITQYPRAYKAFRNGYLVFTLFWLGGYLGATLSWLGGYLGATLSWLSGDLGAQLSVNGQLSVVNVLAFTNSLIKGFDWNVFLMDPVIFILWCATAFGSLMWNRGFFCGWLCPFGALQELTNYIAKKLHVPQFKFPFKVHERMTAIKYIIFLLLFGFSLYDMGLAEHLAEVEPFKTAIILKFGRAWPYVAFALTLLLIGLFIERFYCRYLCPMGAALAIPAKLRLFNWLKRYQECGNPCQKCAQDCPVEAIFPEGNINENECIQCLNCQVLYHDKSRCMHLLLEIAKAQKAAERQKRVEAIRSGEIALKPVGGEPPASGATS